MENLMEKISSLCKRRGFIYPGSEIYGGFGGFWDYGPLGVELKNNLKRLWWKKMVYEREDVVGLDAAIIMNPQVWEASGHTKAFADPLVECKKCHKRFRVDKITLPRHAEFSSASDPKLILKQVQDDDNKIQNDKKVCPECGGELTEPKQFNLLTEVYIGTVEDKKTKAYLRGEITQGVFVNFRNVVDSTRIKIPFGIAQIGKAFRNEITPGNFTFRSREFEQMELEYFVKPEGNEESEGFEGMGGFEYWKNERMKWYLDLGIRKEKLRFRDHASDERAHYARFATDIEYEAPFSAKGGSASGGGWSEFEGIHHRGDYDLGNHKLNYKDENGEEFTPWVIETSGGVDRAALFLLLDAYREDGKRIYLGLKPQLAPYKVAVFPLLVNKPELVELAKKIYHELRQDFYCAWDDRGNIGKRYFSQDEIGTPWCVTVDFDSLKDKTVTVRDRDTAKQERIKISQLKEYFQERLL